MTDANNLRTNVAELCGIRHVFLNQPLPAMAGPELVAAVSEAGGLGVVPALSMSPEQITTFCARVRELTSRPFAIALDVDETPVRVEGTEELFATLAPLLEELGLPLNAEQDQDNVYDLRPTHTYQERFAAALAAKPNAVIAMFDGFREPEAEALQAAGVVNMAYFTSVLEAKVLHSAGCQVLIAQGADASGPRVSFGGARYAGASLLTLVPAAIEATKLPVIALGGIYCRSQVAALRALGAAGIMVGTALLPTEESAAQELYRYWALHGQMHDTILATTYHGINGCRMLKNSFTDWVWRGEPIGRVVYQRIFAAIEQAARRCGRRDLLVYELGLGIGRSAFERVADAVENLSES